MQSHEIPQPISPLERTTPFYEQGQKYQAIQLLMSNTSQEQRDAILEDTLIESVTLPRSCEPPTIADAIRDKSRPASERFTLEFAAWFAARGFEDFLRPQRGYHVTTQTLSQLTKPDWLQTKVNTIMQKNTTF